MNIITPVEYTMNTMHTMHNIPDIENNMYEVLKNRLKVYDGRLVKLEDKINEKYNCVTDCCRFLEGVCMWTLVIMLSIKVFN
jgi:hypothetical protein